MFKDYWQEFSRALKKIGKFLWENTFGRLALFITLVSFLQLLGVWEALLEWFISYFSNLLSFLSNLHFGVPVYYWLIIALSIFSLFFWLLWQFLYLRLVSGVFFDSFRRGLSKWEFGGEGWKIEHEERKPYLSVSQSSDGGITKKGFNWSDYEFVFDMKMINKNAGWIIRAENRNKYLMIQLNMEDLENQKLRLHLRIPPLRIPHLEKSYEWLVIQEDIISLDKPLRFLDWFKVRIVVFGSNIDVYLNGEHAAHYFIPDPIRWQENYRFQGEDKKTGIAAGTYIASTSYPSGKIGFRCSGNEHAHFRAVKVKPLF